ncbi:HNH endonuclease [Leucobacter sp. OH1287]|uniref:HNH endonuclease n=1 Tax=Leucobacter sp. OH1287 TaxID=2491049 RepID=UPI000F5E049F|nr:hypothetical protein [Leucobacter sp. OH1287]RRD61649.1 hypothetical protein EII30_02140 [Leucobacter sp. OH1287]
MAANDFSPRVVAIVRARAAGMCERCGKHARLELHHRKFRSRGGDGSAANAVALCGRGNMAGCHGWVHQNDAAAVEAGFAVPAHSDPADVPLSVPRFGEPVKFLDRFVYTAQDVPCVRHIRIDPSCVVCLPAGELRWQFVKEDSWIE